jgi:peptidoglycan/LPS O-acetylase OafA/YrhL
MGFYAMFAIGALAAGIQVRLTRFRSLLFDVAALAGLGMAIYSITTNFPVPDAFGLANVPYGFPWFPLGVGLILVGVPSSVLLPRVTEIAPIAYVAQVSFGVYVWHYFLMEIVRVLWVSDYVYWGMRDVGAWAWISAGVVIASFVIATLSYHLMEAPVIRWARGLEKRPSPGTPTLSPAAG